VLQAILVLVCLYPTQIKFKCTYSVNHARLAPWNRDSQLAIWNQCILKILLHVKKITNQKACTVTAANSVARLKMLLLAQGNPIISFNITYKTWITLWLRWLATILSMQRPRFNPRPVHTAHVEKMAVGQFFSKHSGFSCQYQSINAPCSCSHISHMLYSFSNWQCH